MLTLQKKCSLKCSDVEIPFLSRNSSTFSDEELSHTLVISGENFILFPNSIYYPLDVRRGCCQARITR